MNKVMYPSPIRIIYPLLSFGGLVKKERNICCFDNRRLNNSKHLLSVLSTARICPSTQRTTTRYLHSRRTETIQKEEPRYLNSYNLIRNNQEHKNIPSPEQKKFNQERKRIFKQNVLNSDALKTKAFFHN